LGYETSERGLSRTIIIHNCKFFNPVDTFTFFFYMTGEVVLI